MSKITNEVTGALVYPKRTCRRILNNLRDKLSDLGIEGDVKITISMSVQDPAIGDASEFSNIENLSIKIVPDTTAT